VSDPVAAREALIIEAIGEAANLIESVERLTPQFGKMGREFDRANAGLRDSLARFEAQVLALTENAKVQAVKHIVARTDEAARRSIEQQGRAMADAAQKAFGAELGATMQRLQATLRLLIEQRERRWERWLTHAAVAAAASAATCAVVVHFVAR
jgi:hypothetical protein